MRRTFVALAFLGLLVAVLYLAGDRNAKKPGLQGSNVAEHPTAPEFALVDLQGRPLNLASYRGKVILLDFWATWCAPCQAEIPRFVEWQQKYGEQGLQVIGISMDDTRGPVESYARNLSINYPVAMGGPQTAELYGGVLGLPVNFVIGRDGRVYAKYVGETDLAVIEREISARLGP